MTKLSKHSQTQGGFTTLIFSMIILFSATMMTLTVAHTSIYEQRMSGNNYRSAEAFFRTDAGLEYIIKWLSITTPSWKSGLNGTEVLELNPVMPELAPYQLSIKLQRNLQFPEIIYILSSATHANDPKWVTQAQQIVEIRNSKAVKLAGTWRDF